MLLLVGCTTVDPSMRLVELARGLDDGPLKSRLLSCNVGRFAVSDFSISHRGAPLGYPEHTKEGYLAAVEMGAGLIECDVTYTKDLQLVCRHSQCDLHRTTNVLATPQAAQCTEPFKPATVDKPASAKCCTSDFTLEEFKALCGRSDRVNERADGVEAYLAGEDAACGTLMTHAESIRLIDRAGRKFVPELKRAETDIEFDAYPDRMIEEYVEAGISPSDVYAQSFDPDVIRHWISRYPDFGKNAVYLDARPRDPDFVATERDMRALKADGFNIIAPAIPALLTVENGELQASNYAKLATAAGLEIITWTFENRIARLPGYVTDDAKTLEVLHALHAKVGVRGIFSDWPGTVTYYANCMGETQ